MTATQENFKEAVTEDQATDESAAEPVPYEQLLLTLQDARVKADDHWNQLLRSRAEMENLRRRAERDLENAHKYSLERLVGELLPVADSLEMGVTAASNEAVDIVKVREGMDLTLRMMQALLQKIGVREVNPQGEKFNPEMHQAMAVQPSADVEPNTVLAVYQKGYLLNDRLVRPAMVVVAKAAQPT